MNPPRKSSYDISSTSFQNADYTTKYIEIFIYKPWTEQQSPLSSPTFSSITKNIQNKLNVLSSEKEFIIQFNNKYII